MKFDLRKTSDYSGKTQPVEINTIGELIKLITDNDGTPIIISRQFFDDKNYTIEIYDDSRE